MSSLKCPTCGTSIDYLALKQEFDCRNCTARLYSNVNRLIVIGILVGSVIAAGISAVASSWIADIGFAVLVPIVAAAAIVRLFGRISVISETGID